MEQSDVSEHREELLQGIERDEEDLRVAVRELAGAARSKLDMREHIKTSPLAWTIGAFLVGMWLGRRGASAGRGGGKEI